MTVKRKPDKSIKAFFCLQCHGTHLLEGDVEDCWNLRNVFPDKHYKSVIYELKDTRPSSDMLLCDAYARSVVLMCSGDRLSDESHPSLLEIAHTIVELDKDRYDGQVFLVDHIDGMRRLLSRLIAVRLEEQYRFESAESAENSAKVVTAALITYCSENPREEN